MLPIPPNCPRSRREVVLAGEDAAVGEWLGDQGVRCRKSAADERRRQVILVSSTPPAFEDLWQRVHRGATAVFFGRVFLRKAINRWAGCRWRTRALVTPIHGWLYLKDEWAKHHPIFAGLPSGGLMDYTFYREIIPDLVLSARTRPRKRWPAHQGFARLLVRADAGSLSLRRRPIHPEHAGDP